MPIVAHLIGIDVTKITDTRFGVMNEFKLILGVVGSLMLPLSALMELQLYRQEKHFKNSRRGDIAEYEYLTKQIVKENEKLEELKKNQTITNETKGFKVEKVDDLERLKELRSWLILYNNLGYDMKKYYKFYQQGKLEEKLGKDYNEYGIEAAKEYLKKNGPKLVRKPTKLMKKQEEK